MQPNYRNIVIAMAGMAQASSLVRDIARTGTCDQQAFITSIQSIYKLQPVDVLDVYGGLDGLRYGLQHLRKLFEKNTSKDIDLSRYFISLIYLERKLAKKKNMLAIIRTRIEQTQRQVEYFSPTHENLIASLATIYLETLSQFPFRVQVLGDSNFLRIPLNINKVRALLLAGVRSTVLWRQLGGTRFQIIFGRNKILKTIDELLL